MFAPAWISAAALAVAAPVSTISPGSEALRLYDKGAFLAAAAVASEGYVLPGAPTYERLQAARLAQEALSRAYQASRGAHPEYLCRALDVLAATLPLAVEPADIQRHQTLTATHQATLAAAHPDLTCEVGTELRPLRGSTARHRRGGPADRLPPPSAPVNVTPSDAPPVNTVNTDDNRRKTASALKISGAVSMTLGVAALAAMAGGLAVRSHVLKTGDSLAALQTQQGYFTPTQQQTWSLLAKAGTTGHEVALVGGITGAVLLVLGSTLIARGQVLSKRTLVLPTAGLGQAGLMIEGRF